MTRPGNVEGKPELADLYCGAGGCTKGYQMAGFYVVGVDINLQPHYCGDEFHQADALTFPLEGFDVIHASPPCQGFTALRSMWQDREYVDLLTPTRERLKVWGGPYVIENVEGAPMPTAFRLCGTVFGLGTGDAELRRHRWFESSVEIGLIPPCWHGQRQSTIGVYGHAGGSSNRTRRRVIGVYGGHGRDRRRDSGQGFSTAERAEAMGIDWMNGQELSQAIPPAYTQFIGEQLMAHLGIKA